MKTNIGILLLKNKAIDDDDKSEQRSNVLPFELLNEYHYAQLLSDNNFINRQSLFKMASLASQIQSSFSFLSKRYHLAD